MPTRLIAEPCDLPQTIGKHDMKIVYRLLAVACFSMAGLAACGTDSAPVDTTGTGTADQTVVVRYTAKDIAALPAGEFVNFDLTQPNTVYVLTYSNPADLDHVLVSRSSGQSVLSDGAPAAENVQGDDTGLKEIVLSAEDPELGGTISPNHCLCPCCEFVNNHGFCC